MKSPSTHSSIEEWIVALDGFRKIYCAGPVVCDKSEPESIAKISAWFARERHFGFYR
jgi:hypothetical protein